MNSFYIASTVVLVEYARIMTDQLCAFWKNRKLTIRIDLVEKLGILQKSGFEKLFGVIVSLNCCFCMHDTH